MKNIIFIVAVAASIISEAQVSSVSIQASGLTCSMCSNAINKSLKTLDFVDKVDADMSDYTFVVTFKPGGRVDFDLLKNKVESAGFAVCSFVATVHFNAVQASEANPLVTETAKIIFPAGTDTVLNGDQKIRLLDKGFVSAKEYKKHAPFGYEPRAYHVSF